MKLNGIRVCQWLVLAAAPLALFARSGGPPPGRTGAKVDGGLDCTACHRTFAPANSGAGRMRIDAASYTPGVKQNVTLTIEDPDAARWGFQLTSRLKSDETKAAGGFTASDDIRVICGMQGSSAPCNGEIEFASHTAPSTQRGARGSGTFTVEWTPPAQDMGEIVFYAAGNAADSGATNAGDRIYTSMLVLRPACTLTQRPTVQEVIDAASFRPVITSNALITLKGGPFAAGPHAYQAAASDQVDRRMPNQLACVAVEVAGKRAPVLWVRHNQINAQAPILDVIGPVDVRVILNPGMPTEVRSDAVRAQANLHAPSLFTFDGKSVAALNASREFGIVADAALVPGAAPARPGDTVVLYGTGFGYTDPVFQPGEFAHVVASLRDPYTISIGGVTLSPADILFAGLSPEYPGFYQFNLRLSPALADGNAPVSIRIGGIETQAGVTIPVRR